MENNIPEFNTAPLNTEAAAPKKFCGHCGAEISATTAFCPNCGTPVAPAFAAPEFTMQPKKKKKTGLIIGIVAAVVVIAILAIVLIGGGSGSSSSGSSFGYDPDDEIVGSWNGFLAFVDDEEISVPDGFATGYLYSDNTGTVYVDGDSLEFTWAYDETDEEGDMFYTLNYDSLDVGTILYDPVAEHLYIAFDETLVIVFERD